MRISNFFKTKTGGWILFVIVVIWIISVVSIGEPWWSYLPVFFAFMSTFCNLASIYIAKISPVAAKKLNTIQTVLGVLFLIALFVVYYFLYK